MKHLYSQFLSNLQTLKNYNILTELEDHWIIGTNIHFTYKKDYKGLFSHNTFEETKIFPIFFILAFNDTFPGFKEYKTNKYPILILSSDYKYASKYEIEKELENFISFKF